MASLEQGDGRLAEFCPRVYFPWKVGIPVYDSLNATVYSEINLRYFFPLVLIAIPHINCGLLVMFFFCLE